MCCVFFSPLWTSQWKLSNSNRTDKKVRWESGSRHAQKGLVCWRELAFQIITLFYAVVLSDRVKLTALGPLGETSMTFSHVWAEAAGKQGPHDTHIVAVYSICMQMLRMMMSNTKTEREARGWGAGGAADGARFAPATRSIPYCEHVSICLEPCFVFT